ncbi:TPM domain-containing protein [Desulfosediminicola ganghwensis]|uniref:TPM domain-containing protein n=1 Tax=Desulfosediminicola ganghwensis TaxID=2569540 RepID=UPI001E300C41|nr:TPM domain-containing protein [Desulfosediminicola ganghwensis]
MSFADCCNSLYVHGLRICRAASGMALSITIIAVLGLQAPSAGALEVPPLTARINDYAKMLNPATVSQLENSLKTFEDEQSTQLVVLTIESLEGDSLEDFSIRVAENWRIGQADLDNGAILLIAQNDRKIRIEVGYGLEPTLTDLTSGRIIREIIAPLFKRGDFDQGVINGVNAMMDVVRGEFSAPENQASQNQVGLETFPIMLMAVLLFIGKAFGKHKALAAAIGGVAAPVLGYFILGAKWLLLAVLVPAGAVGGLIASAFAASSLNSRTIHRGSGRHYGGYGSGGLGGGFGGGFGGGGGGFGGGGASGGW